MCSKAPRSSSSARNGRMDCCPFVRICSKSRTTALVTHGYYSKIRGLTVILHSRSDVDLTAFYRVAWQRENVRIGADAQRQIAKSRACFLELIDKDPSVVIYGVTTAMGERASHRLTPGGARSARAHQAVPGRDLVRRLSTRSRGAGDRLRPPHQLHRGPLRHHAAHRASRRRDAGRSPDAARSPPQARAARARSWRSIRCSRSSRPASISR